VSVVDAVRGLAKRQEGAPVISFYLDLDPESFATAPARATQIRSLIDEAAREVESDSSLAHDEKQGLREDLKRIDDYLRSPDAPFQGARSLAVFSSTPDGLSEAVQVPRPVQARVVIERRPYVEPLVEATDSRRWCVVLVSRREGRVLAGPADCVRERQSLHDNVHGQHEQGGWSQANYERSVEKDADDHLRRIADAVKRRYLRERFVRLAVGGPHEVVARFEGMLSDELRARLAPERVHVDLSSATDEQLRAAVSRLVEHDEQRRERGALDLLAERLGAGGRAAGGPEATLAALNERRVETLLLDSDAIRPNRRGARCPSCGLLTLEDGECPADGTTLENVDLREATVESALAQDAEVLLTRHYRDLGPHEGIAALLRF
jgi:peptide chain release factor subunit 1